MNNSVSANQNTPSSLIYLSRNSVAKTIKDSVSGSRVKVSVEKGLQELKAPSLIQEYIGVATPIAARRIAQSCSDYYYYNDALINSMLALPFNRESEGDLFETTIKPIITKIEELEHREIYAFKHDSPFHRNFNCKNPELYDHGDLLAIMRYIESSSHSTFSVTVATILLEYYLDFKPNIIILLDTGYPLLTSFAKNLDRSRLTEEQKLICFKEYISFLNDYYSEAQSIINNTDINDLVMQLSPFYLRYHLGIRPVAYIDFLGTASTHSLINIRSMTEVTYEKYQLAFNNFTGRSV